ncbi:MAG: CvpA family protein [Kiritimatiellae bacterium]|nr:CvpA family protein [Kiritimatiellia bacterium]
MTAAASALFAAAPAPALWWIDAAVAALLCLALVFGAFNGLSGEAARLVAFAVALVAAGVVYSALRSTLFPEDGAAARILSLAAALAGAACVCIVLRRLLRRFLKAAIPQPLDALLGAAFRGATTCVVFLAVFAVLRVIPSETLQDAVFARTVSGRAAAPALDAFERRARPAPAAEDPATPEPAAPEPAAPAVAREPAA